MQNGLRRSCKGIILGMRIGEFASKAGVNVQTIRFYERRRLLREPQRSASGYRSYDTNDLESVVFIKWCQQLGFALKEIQQLLRLHSAVAHVPPARLKPDADELLGIIRMAEEKIVAIRSKMKVLRAMERDILQTIRRLQSAPGPTCPASAATKTASRLAPRRS